MPSPPFEVLDWGSGVDLGIVTLQKLGWQSGPFQRKITRDLARAFLKPPKLSILPTDFLNCGSDRYHDVGSPFRHFWRFSSLTALLNKFGWFYDIFLSLYTLCTKDFFPAIFLQPWRARRQKCAPPSQLGPDGIWVFEVVWPALPAEQLIRAGRF
jgi:hypothetical protein